MSCYTYHLTISPETPEDLDRYVGDLHLLRNLMKLYIRREFGDEGDHPHLHCILTFEDEITVQTLMPRLKKVFGFIPKKPLVLVQKLDTHASIANLMNYIHEEEGSIQDAKMGYLEGEVEQLVAEGKANRVKYNERKNLTLTRLEKVIDWTKIKDRRDITKELMKLKKEGYDVLNIITNPRRLALWYHFMIQYHNPKYEDYDSHVAHIFNPIY